MSWKSAYLENRILSASPLELVTILYEQAIVCVDRARECIQNDDITGRSAAILKAIAIVNELDCSLNHEVGGEVSKNLARLYRYIRERLISANLRQEDKTLSEVRALLGTVGEAWNKIQEPGKEVFARRFQGPTSAGFTGGFGVSANESESLSLVA